MNNKYRFTYDLVVKELDGGEKHEVVEQFGAMTPFGEIVVPVGFITDYASTPRLLWRAIPPFGKYTRASVVHDFLYSHHRLRQNSTQTISRFVADRIFYELMLVSGVKKLKAKIMYWGVRLRGGSHW